MPNKNLKIACLGCSWTRGLSSTGNGDMPDNETYPYHLMTYLGNNGIKADIIQAGRPGAGVEYCHLVADYLLKEFDPDLFVFQLDYGGVQAVSADLQLRMLLFNV